MQMFHYLPELRPLWSFSQDIYRLLDDSKTLRVARWRYTLLKHDPKYQQVRELVEALDLLAEPKLTKVMAFVQQPSGQAAADEQSRGANEPAAAVRGEGALSLAEAKWVVRWVVLLLDVCWQEAAEPKATRATATATGAPLGGATAFQREEKGRLNGGD